MTRLCSSWSPLQTSTPAPHCHWFCLLRPADPEFRKPLRATYNFEKLQPMRLAVYDVDVREKDNRKLKLAEQASVAGWGHVPLHV